MTDRELALNLGKRLIDSEIKIAVLKGTFDNFKLNDGSRVNWEEMVHETLLSPIFVQKAQDRFDELQTAIDEDMFGEPLIRILHQVLFDS
jgi:hypothetical protein